MSKKKSAAIQPIIKFINLIFPYIINNKFKKGGKK